MSIWCLTTGILSAAGVTAAICDSEAGRGNCHKLTAMWLKGFLRRANGSAVGS